MSEGRRRLSAVVSIEENLLMNHFFELETEVGVHHACGLISFVIYLSIRFCEFIEINL